MNQAGLMEQWAGTFFHNTALLHHPKRSKQPMNKNRFPPTALLAERCSRPWGGFRVCRRPANRQVRSNRCAKADPGLPYVYTKWEQITTKDGLPNDHIFAIKADPTRGCVWIGTEDGLACYDKKTKKIKTWTEKDGLPWRVVTAIDVDPKTGEVWLGLFGGGLARFSGGRFDQYNQLNSGLPNDVVYAVALDTKRDQVWCSTTAGAGRFSTKTGKWDIFTEKNSPMEEIWNYNVCCRDDKVYLAVWGSGALEYDCITENWKAYLDPDGEMEIDLYRDDGIIHNITTSASYVDKVLWISTYFGVCPLRWPALARLLRPRFRLAQQLQ